MSSPGTVRGVADLLGLAALESPDKLALVETAGRSLTWAQLDDEVDRVATGLADAGIIVGHRVAIVTANRLEFVVTYLAVLRVQAVAVPLNPRGTGTELARAIGDSGARIVVADAEGIDAVREATSYVDRAMAGELDLGQVDADFFQRTVQPQVFVVGATLLPGERGYDDLRAQAARPVPPVTDPERLAVLLYTSGTSGRPRAAMLTHRALLANVDQIAAVEPPMIHGDDVVLGVLPLFHVYGLNAVLGSVLRHRAKLMLVDRFDPQSALDLIEDEACSVVPVAPPVLAYWMQDPTLEERLGPVRLLLSGSAPLDPDLVDAFTTRTKIPVHQGYGLTEAAPVVTSTLCSVAVDVDPRSVGAALPGVELRLVDEAGGAPEQGDPGELLLRGPNLFSGYWPDGADGPDPDGWWATGDVGFLSPDGDITLVDRLKDLVIVSGFNVYPVEVEDAIAEVAGVADVAVIGVPDEQTGEAVVAYVVPASGAPGDLAFRVRSRCAERLAGFKQPSRVELVDALPHTATGKVQKGRLRNMERRRVMGLLE
ncbi:long-chain acyl-CoA synthetase [Nocardioides terrae]|uniref:Long-chain acyl-CoA synthetase n=1 Tax=Nocardioides terrae TaxID=574651 RepID=A0A1I1HBV8_9ACTN|nr:AMP-binding protein [Nocardioides terrae]SFC21276.1 long-chain acyl-CoA synthetase [Nocardioides terrae]